MHKQFGEWHLEAHLDVNSESSPKHWKVIEEYEPDAAEVTSLARFFYGFSDSDSKSVEKFGTTLQDADPKFVMQRDTRLLSVLAGAELIDVIERHDDTRLAEMAALCLVCGAAQGARSGNRVPVPSMAKIAARYVEGRTTKRAGEELVSEEPDADSRFNTLQRELTIVGEETNILWWLFSEYSRDTNQPWKVLKLPATSIIAGKELADLTRVIPGPVAAVAFLDRIVRCSCSARSIRAVKLMDAIEKTPRLWRDGYPFAPTGLVDLMPISNGLRLSLTVSDGDDWVRVFENGTAITADSTMAPNILAYQVFLERMLARLREEIG